MLYYLIQRYKFESNSQPATSLINNCCRCIIWYKDTNLKAIHNKAVIAEKDAEVVLSDTKIQIWKQFTTYPEGKARAYCCIIWYKDTNLKAIHNTVPHGSTMRRVVLSDTKIQIWKQFTTVIDKAFLADSCIIWYKDTNLKAIHNVCNTQVHKVQVVLSDTKIQIWKQFTTPQQVLPFD